MTSANARTGLDPARLKEALAKLRTAPMIGVAVAIAASLAILIVLLLWARSPDYKPLYSNLSDRDGGAIVAQLEQMQIPYRFSAGGSTVLIPTEQIDRTRLTLAGLGLPKGGAVGFELMDAQPFGVSQFTEHVNYQRALEGELARSIETLGPVASARVHLAIPQPTVFVRDRRTPSASVVVELHPGRALDTSQVAAVTHLVSSSVSEMPIDGISVVDQNGNLLTRSGLGDAGADDARLKYTQEVEERLRKRIEALIGALVGRDNVLTTVTADIDYSSAEHTQEHYDPNADPQSTAVRSRQSNDAEQLGANGIGGVPGALSNQAPESQPQTINAQQGEQAEGDEQDEPNRPPSSMQRSETVNYELNRMVRHVREARGAINRLSVAVAVNYRADAEGVAQPLDAEVLERISRLVRETMGFSESRGDSLEVVNAPFSESVDVVVESNWWQDPRLIELALDYARYIAIALVAWLLWRRLVRPALNRQRVEREERTRMVAEAESEAMQTASRVEAEQQAQIHEQRNQLARKRQDEQRIQRVREKARKDPRLIAMILKGWMNEDDQRQR